MNFFQNSPREYVDGIGNVVSKFKTHSSTVKFKKHFKIKNTFSFSSGSKYEVSNYCPVLPLRYKIFERVFYNQLGEYVDLFLSKVLCGFRKAHSTQHA